MKEETINGEVEFLVLASDGLWDVVSNQVHVQQWSFVACSSSIIFVCLWMSIIKILLMQDAVSMVQSIPNAEEAAKKLTEEALNRGSADNITCVIVRFHNEAVIA